RRVGSEGIESHRPVPDQELPEKAATLRKGPDVIDGLLIEPVVNEPLDPSRVVVHAERGVASSGHFGSARDDAVQDAVRVGLGGELERDLEDGAAAWACRIGGNVVPAGGNLRDQI